VKIYLSYRERVAGLFMVFTVMGVVAFVVFAAIQNRWLEPRRTYHTHVVRGDALRSGSPVLLSGIEIGEIGDLTILPDNRIDVELLIRERYASRVRVGTVAEVRRLVGLGEKRILLVAETTAKHQLPPGALIPASEPMDIMDAIANVDLGRYVDTLDRAVATMEITLKKLEEKDRLERMMQAFDEMGPALERINDLLTDLHDPLVTVISDPNFPKAVSGASRLFNDKNVYKSMAAVSKSFDPERMGRLIDQMNKTFARLDELAAEDGELTRALASTNELMGDERLGKLIDSMEKLTDAEKLTKLVDNMAIVAREMAKMGPEIPTLSREMLSTLREAVIVLKALQKTWILKDEAREVKSESKKKR
jgi:phospholipid/cholesterol/gamma-HCH transport system substrate-binding protein